MNTTSLVVWQSFLHSSSADRQGRLLNCVSPDFFSELISTEQGKKELENWEPIEDELDKIHSSWLTPFLRSLPENEIKLFLSSLPHAKIQSLKKSLLLSNTIPLPSELGKSYLKKTLFDTISPPDLLPISLLPEDGLNALLDLSYEEIISLIDLLGMHDLAVEIKHVIETTKLKEIYGILTKPQEAFLKTLLHKKEAVSFKKMGLLAWNGNREVLKSMLLQRGINRIAKSLYGKHPSLVWYVAHRLDSDKGQNLIKLCTELDHPRASALLAEQVIELIQSFKTNNLG